MEKDFNRCLQSGREYLSECAKIDIPEELYEHVFQSVFSGLLPTNRDKYKYISINTVSKYLSHIPNILFGKNLRTNLHDVQFGLFRVLIWLIQEEKNILSRLRDWSTYSGICYDIVVAIVSLVSIPQQMFEMNRDLVATWRAMQQADEFRRNRLEEIGELYIELFSIDEHIGRATVHMELERTKINDFDARTILPSLSIEREITTLRLRKNLLSVLLPLDSFETRKHQIDSKFWSQFYAIQAYNVGYALSFMKKMKSR